MAFGVLSVKGRALRYLSQREHSHAELAQKLARKVEDTEAASASQQIQAALDELAAHGLLSEERAAASVLHTQGRRYGERRLRQSLQAKGFAPDLVASTLAQARSGEFERARDVWQRKFGAPPQDATERARQMRFLLGRGFTGEVVSRVLRACGAEPADDDTAN
jgi:regulatory protein